MKRIVITDKSYVTLVKKSPKGKGYIASTWTFDGKYVGCKHLYTSVQFDEYLCYQESIGRNVVRG